MLLRWLLMGDIVYATISPSIMLSPPKPQGGILPNLLQQLCKSNIIFCVCVSVFVPCKGKTLFIPMLLRWLLMGDIVYATISPSIMLSPPKPQGGILPNLLQQLCKSNIIFCVCVCPCVCHHSICPSCYCLLNHWAEFNQTCYITSPHGKGVWEQHYFSVHPSYHASFIHLSVHHAISS